ncbi:MAG: metal ABC transporter ATP-binding protein [Dermatophilaceae bacterium]|jgi:zinc transport system ATP-binding protein|nr:metal ABC transporter ATP-binding protein [Dermatophilaceae bacterium]HOI04161.1 metal ABC transporter ATP-binding protein [Dermatophilaceae bacterium]
MSTPPAPPTPDPPATAPPVIALRGASFGYGDHAVVHDVDLTITAGEVVLVLGPNGSGKSTIAKGLFGLTDLLAGEVDVFGMPRADFRDFPRLGYVPQRHTLASSVTVTVSEVVSSGRLSRQSWLGIATRADRQQVRRALELVGLADRAGIDVGALSGGQQRRVLIARALAGEPDVLVMDEPTAGVDIASQHGLVEVLARLVAEGLTLVVVTHELAAFADLVTRVVVVDAGRIAFDGSRDEFVAAGSDVLHDHDWHHHLDRPDLRPAVISAEGPLSQGGSRE